MELNLFKKIGISFLLGVIMPLGILVFFIKEETTESMVEEVYERNLLLSSQLSLQIDSFSSTIEGTLNTISQLPEMRSEYPEEITETLGHYAQYFNIFGEKVFESFLLVDSSGKIKSCYPYKNEYIGLDYSHYPFFQKIADNKEDIYISQDSWISAITSRSMVRIAVPIKGPEGKILGVLGADIGLSALCKVSSQIQLGETGQAFILDKKGVFVSHPEKVLVLERQNVNNIFPGLFDKMRREESGIVLWPEKNSNTIFSFSSPDMTEWKVIFTQSLDEALETPSALQRMFVFVFFFILTLTIVIVFIITALITHPVKKLGKAVRTMAQGDLKARADINAKDEIGDLTKDINTMAEKLENSYEKLEESKVVLEIKVKARTIELERLNKSLEQRVEERTNALQKQLKELEKWGKLTVDRELKMVELKQEMKRLEEQLGKKKEEKFWE